MADSGEMRSEKVLVLANALEKLRTHSGLTADRVRADRTGISAPLLTLAATQRYADVHALDLPDAAVALVGECVRDDLSQSQRIVADIILALGVLEETLRAAGIDPHITRALYQLDLGRRRETLLNHWHPLHAAVSVTPQAAPSDRYLRGTTELAALRELAYQLTRRDTYSVGAKNVVRTDPGPRPELSSSGRVVVIGGAVMDATFRTKHLPAPETSSEALGFSLAPGGKGLTQAVAAARLGLRTSLIAAVATDSFGDKIVEYLEQENVDTSLLKRVPGADTPFTGVFQQQLGDSIAVNWRNDKQIHLDAGDVFKHRKELQECDAVLLTFEVPRDTLEDTLALVHDDAGKRPVVIVTPGQPYPDDEVSADTLAQIDYLVAHAWELESFVGQDADFDPDSVARTLLAYGVKTLCLLVRGGCNAYSRPLRDVLRIAAPPAIYKESAVARDAFCAALAARLIDTKYEFSDKVAHWAAAAMSCAASDFPRRNSLPTRRRIEDLLEGLQT
ncbi:PfkB family carbohydrate kinase [Kribbella jejuensis]|uniref:Ribokinase n=1 Tax=Kribbella jejuensis TaxID=236068 RepID=A0A542D9E8_9ACTN|nr:PfkB family carbohydrate kinase [Kribbella jejuensis]TQI99698.1 ribokinase [Kribbella jejuensis]